MTNQMMPRAGAGCGALFAVALIATSNGSADANYIAGLAAIALFLPFLAYLCSLLREAEGEHGWLATAALAAGVAGITIKLASVAPEIAANHLASGAVHNALQDIADEATVISMYPLALLLAAVAIIALRTRVLSRWLGYGAAVTAAALAVNAGFIHATNVPAFLLFALWTLAASAVLFVKARSQAVHVTPRPAPNGLFVSAPVSPPGGWVYSSQVLSASGRTSLGPEPRACVSGSWQACLSALGKLHLQQTVTYQPASRYWTLQWAETSIFLALALVLAGFCFWWIRRRLPG